MAIHNFTLADCIGIFAGFGLFSLIAFVPGYAFGWLLDVVRFRSRTLSIQLAMSVPLSIAFGPILSYFIGRWLSLRAVWVVYGVLCVYALFLAVRRLKKEARPSPRLSKFQVRVLGLVLVWIVIATLALTDLQIHDRLYYPMASFDYSVRTAFTSAISASGIPAQNPFFFPGHPVALRYHYFWLIPCALVHRIGSPLLDVRQALVAGTIWCGIGLICLVPLYLRLFSRNKAADLSRRTILGIVLLGITGLDILPACLMLWLSHKGVVGGVSPSVEWWNNQVDGWLFTMLWEPHYVASLIACLTGFLIIWDVIESAGGLRRSLISAIAAGLAFATAVGAGIYVALVFAVFLTVWTVITLWKKWYQETAVLVLSGAVALAASLPFLISLQSPGSGGSFLQLTVRSFDLAEIFLKFLGLDRPWQIVLANSVFLPANYALEFGFFFAVGVLVWNGFRSQKRRATRQELAAFTMAATSILVCTFLKSGVITNNDLGWRGFLIAQFMLLIWAADLVTPKSADLSQSAPKAVPASPVSSTDRAILTVLFVLGLAGVIYDLAIGRFYPLLSDAQKVPKIFWLADDEKLGRRTFANREAYEWLKARTSAHTIMQQNPDQAQDTFYGLYANRPTVAEDPHCGTGFGGEARECLPIVARLTELFSAGANSSTASFDAVCQSLPVDIFVAKDTDGAWKDSRTWVWTRKPIFANDFVRLFTCSRIGPPTLSSR